MAVPSAARRRRWTTKGVSDCVEVVSLALAHGDVSPVGRGLHGEEEEPKHRAIGDLAAIVEDPSVAIHGVPVRPHARIVVPAVEARQPSYTTSRRRYPSPPPDHDQRPPGTRHNGSRQALGAGPMGMDGARARRRARSAVAHRRPALSRHTEPALRGPPPPRPRAAFAIRAAIARSSSRTGRKGSGPPRTAAPPSPWWWRRGCR